MLAGLRAGACAKCRAGRASCAGCGVGVVQTRFLVVEVSFAKLGSQEEPDTLSTAASVAEPEQSLIVRRKPWKGGTEVTPFRRVASKNHDFAHSF